MESVKQFSWEAVHEELAKHLPTLMALLSNLIPKHPEMALVQRAVSVMMYGNNVQKQVYANLQPLNVCLTYQGTTNIVKGINRDYDAEVREWEKNWNQMKKRFGQATTPVSESTQSTRSVPERYANISKSESEITNVYAPSYSIITTTDSHSDVQLEDESLKEAASVDGGIGDIVMPERTEQVAYGTTSLSVTMLTKMLNLHFKETS